MNTPLIPGLMVIHGNQPESLSQLLGQWFEHHPLHPLEKEIILVQSNGMAQWLKMNLARHSGIAAGLEMLLPSRFIWNAYRCLLGADDVPESSPFDQHGLLWRLMRLLPSLCQQPGYETLRQFLGQDPEGRKAYQLSDKIAGLFDQYLVYRADWLTDWAQHRDQLAEPRHPATPLESDQCWQPRLWRALLEDIGPETPSRALIHQRFLEQAAQLKTIPSGLPRRITVFGLSSLTAQALDVLRALARVTQVLLFVHNPCQHYWGDALSTRDLVRRQLRRQTRKPGTPAQLTTENLHQHSHPLLAAWGKQGRDYLELLEELDEPEHYRERFTALNTRIDLFESPGRDTLLHQLQDDLLNLEPLNPDHPQRLANLDRSIQFHSTHGPQREVEVLHDQLLALFNGEGEWRPREILVMVPDITVYAPHIAAVFGRIDPQDPRYIPYSLADHTDQRQIPLRLALDLLLTLPERRLSVTDLLSLLEVAAVRRRFAIDADDLPLLQRWIRDTQIRWGLDEPHRQRFIPQSTAQNTWMQGMRQMLLGYAMGQDPSGRISHEWHGIEPYDEVAGLDAALAGSLAQLLQQLQQQLTRLTQPATPACWYERLESLLQDFFSREESEDATWLMSWLDILAQWRSTCQQVGLETPLSLAVVRDHWLAQLDAPLPTQRFMAGRLTFATLLPMRAIPFRMIALLGLNDGDFPRHRLPLDFDLMTRQMRPGDRSRREDDRYLFLEALLSARDRLYLSWVGHSPQDNSECPPSVLVSQLRDHLDAGWRTESGIRASAALTVEHFLQPFHPAYFGTDPQARWFTYAHEWCQSLPHTPSTAALPPLTPEAPISLGDMMALLKNPARTFHRQRLKLYLDTDDQAPQDQEPFALDDRQRWTVQQKLIEIGQDVLQSTRDDPDRLAMAVTHITREVNRQTRRGALPVGAWGSRIAEELTAPLGPLLTIYDQLCQGRVRAADRVLDHFIPEMSVRIDGVIDNLWIDPYSPTQLHRMELVPQTLIREKKPRHDKLLSAWIRHLAGHQAFSETTSEITALTTWIIGLDSQILTFPPLDPPVAAIHFAALVSAYRRNLVSALPLAPKTGFAWLNAGGHACGEGADESDQPAWPPQNALNQARSAYDGGFNHSGERTYSADLARAFPTFEQLWAEGAMAELCRQLYAPLKATLIVDDRPVVGEAGE